MIAVRNWRRLIDFGQIILVSGLTPSERCESNWVISPNRDENKTYLKPPLSI